MKVNCYIHLHLSSTLLTVAWTWLPPFTLQGNEDLSITRKKFSYSSKLLSSTVEMFSGKWVIPAVSFTKYGPGPLSSSSVKFYNH